MDSGVKHVKHVKYKDATFDISLSENGDVIFAIDCFSLEGESHRLIVPLKPDVAAGAGSRLSMLAKLGEQILAEKK